MQQDNGSVDHLDLFVVLFRTSFSTPSHRWVSCYFQTKIACFFQIETRSVIVSFEFLIPFTFAHEIYLYLLCFFINVVYFEEHFLNLEFNYSSLLGVSINKAIVVACYGRPYLPQWTHKVISLSPAAFHIAIYLFFPRQ